MESKANTLERDESVDEVNVGEDGMTIKAPKAGNTVEDPPNGGFKAWFTAAICCLINFCLGAAYTSLSTALTQEELATDSGQDADYHIETYGLYQSMTGVFSPIAALSIMYLGYRVTVFSGGIVSSMTFVSVAFTRPDEYQYFRYCLLGPAAFGTSFVVMGSLIPILEYFTTKRMRALFFTNLCLFVGAFVFAITMPLSDQLKDLGWSKQIRYICGVMFGVIAGAGLFLQELKLKMKDNPKETFIQRALGFSDLAILKNVWLIDLLAILFIFNIGMDAVVSTYQQPDVLSTMTSSITNLVLYIILPFFARIIGAALAWILKRLSVYPKESGRGYIFVIIVVAGISLVVGVMAFASTAAVFGMFFTGVIVSTLTKEYFESLRDDYVPLLFGRSHIRMSEGLLLFVIGLGGVISTEVAAAIDTWYYVFDFGGSVLMLSAVIAVIAVVYLTQARKGMVAPTGDGEAIEIRDR